MELYILDSLLRRIDVVDVYESCIWTDRYNVLGDFEVKVTSTNGMRAKFLQGTKVALNKSDRVMVVESVEDTNDDEGRKILNVKGRSLEMILMNRIAKYTLAEEADPWTITATPANVGRQMFDHICRNGMLDIHDKIPLLMPGTFYPTNSIPEPSEIITWEPELADMYTAEKAVLDPYDLGFRLVLKPDTSQLYFDIYSGNDRTTGQTNFTPVVFSPKLDTLSNTTEFTSIENYKNVAYVFSPDGFKVVYADNVDETVAGFERRVLIVNLETAPEEVVDTDAYIIRRGKEELAKTRAMTVFDGELNIENDNAMPPYYVGDMVERRNLDGVTFKTRVTEKIYVEDQEGERSYPTLASAVYDGSNTWLYQDTRVWTDFGDTDYWSTQP